MTIKDKIGNKTHLGKLIFSPYLELIPEGKKSRLIIVGAIGVSELNDGGVLVKCHGIKLRILGKEVRLNVLEHNTLEILGAVEDIKILNARN